MSSPPRTIGQRYVLRHQIGHGGMGAVWLADDEVLGREVALKRVGLFPGGSSPDLLRAQREAKLAAKLNHPHVVAVFDFVSDRDEQWLVMEHVDGADLAVLAEHADGLLPDEAAALLAQVAQALAAAHAAGIVHRDVKPSNVMVTHEGTAKLADFGIARARDSTMTASGVVTGSPAYLAPEVASGHPATEASDVWSLGATLYQALTGRPPYDTSDNVLSAMYRIVHEDPPRLPGTGWPAGLLETTMAKDPADRWPMSRVRDYLAAGPPPVEETPPTVPLAAADAHGIDGGDEVDTLVVPGAHDGPPPGRSVDSDENRDEDGGRRSVLVPILVGVALLIGLVLAWALLRPDPTPTADEPAGTSTPEPKRSSSDTASRTASPTRSSTPSSTPSPAPSSTPAPSESAPPSTPAEPTSSATAKPPAGAGEVAAMRTFVQSYVATALADPASAWEQLTPRFQQDCCDGIEGNYAGYWTTIATATLRDIKPNPAADEVTYTITWDPEGERGPEDEVVTLGLVENGDGYLIDYEL